MSEWLMVRILTRLLKTEICGNINRPKVLRRSLTRYYGVPPFGRRLLLCLQQPQTGGRVHSTSAGREDFKGSYWLIKSLSPTCEKCVEVVLMVPRIFRELKGACRPGQTAWALILLTSSYLSKHNMEPLTIWQDVFLLFQL